MLKSNPLREGLSLRGEYKLGNGVVLHNQFTDAGLVGVLAAAFQNSYPVSGLHIGLCQAVPGRALTLADLIEPSIGVNGYARQAINRDAVDWLTTGTQADDPFIETKTYVFAATGAAFDQEVTRLFLTPEATATTGDVWAVSAAFETPKLIDPLTLEADRSFTYRVYGV